MLAPRPSAWAIVAARDPVEREFMVLLLEEYGFHAIVCTSGDTVIAVLERLGSQVKLLVVHHDLAGDIDGEALSYWAKWHRPQLHVVVATSASSSVKLPDDAIRISLPWLPLEVLKQAARAFP